MDETGLQFTHRPVKVVAEKGMRQLYARTSDSKESVTVIVCINAAGALMPASIIAKGKTTKSLEGFATYLMPKETLWTYQARGWMENAIGLQWFVDIFLKNCGPRRPQLLLLDRHSSHETLKLIVKSERREHHHMGLTPTHDSVLTAS